VFKDRDNAYGLRLKLKDKFNENIHGFLFKLNLIIRLEDNISLIVKFMFKLRV
jgi:hypothetical protein